MQKRGHQYRRVFRKVSAHIFVTLVRHVDNFLTLLSTVLEGASSIRVFQREKTFVDRFRCAADDSSSALFNFVTAQRWLGVRIEILGSLVVLTSTLLVISMNDQLHLDPGLVGLLIIWSANFTITLVRTPRVFYATLWKKI